MKNIPVVVTLIGACVLMFFGEMGSGGQSLIEGLALWPLGLGTAMGTSLFHPWQILSYAFLHGGVTHLVLNLYALWLFGTPLELRWGPRRFAAYYFICVVGAALIQLIVAEFSLAEGMRAHPVIGASGGIFGLLMAFGYLYPERRLILLIPPMLVKARWFVIGYGVVELVAGVTGTANGIAHFAHLGGMLTGYLLLRGAAWL